MIEKYPKTEELCAKIMLMLLCYVKKLFDQKSIFNLSIVIIGKQLKIYMKQK